MSQLPPDNDLPDELDELYRRAANAEAGRPSAVTRRAILEHAADLVAPQLAQSRAHAQPTPASRWRWRPATYGGLLAAGLAGLVLAPRLLGPGTPPAARESMNTAIKTPPVTASLATAPSVSAPAPPPHLTEIAPVREAPAAPMPFPASPAADRREEYSRAPSRKVAPMMAAPGASQPDVAVSPAPAASPPPAPAADAAAPAIASAPPLASEQTLAGGARAGLAAERSAGAANDRTALLHAAAKSGDLASLRALLREPIDLNAPDRGGHTALMLATLNGHAEAVDALLSAGADPNVADADGTTPFRAALNGHRAQIAAALQRAGAL